MGQVRRLHGQQVVPEIPASTTHVAAICATDHQRRDMGLGHLETAEATRSAPLEWSDSADLYQEGHGI